MTAKARLISLVAEHAEAQCRVTAAIDRGTTDPKLVAECLQLAKDAQAELMTFLASVDVTLKE